MNHEKRCECSKNKPTNIYVDLQLQVLSLKQNRIEGRIRKFRKIYGPFLTPVAEISTTLSLKDTARDDSYFTKIN